MRTWSAADLTHLIYFCHRDWHGSKLPRLKHAVGLTVAKAAGRLVTYSERFVLSRLYRCSAIFTPSTIKNRATLFLIITPGFLGQFLTTFCTSGNRNEYSAEELIKFTTSP